MGREHIPRGSEAKAIALSRADSAFWRHSGPSGIQHAMIIANAEDRMEMIQTWGVREAHSTVGLADLLKNPVK